MCCGNEAGSYLRLVDSCITQLQAQGTSRTCNESKEEEEKAMAGSSDSAALFTCSTGVPHSEETHGLLELRKHRPTDPLHLFAISGD